MGKKIILAYSGGVDTTLAIPYLKEKYNYDVIALAIDLGEEKDLETLRSRALQVGASECHIIDARVRFAEKYLSLALRSNALYEQRYPLISALSRPLIATLLVEAAHNKNADAVAHGCTAKGNDQVRFDLAISILDPHLKIVAPLRENPIGRETSVKQLEDRGVFLPLSSENPYSIDRNIWGRSCECGILEDPWKEPPPDAYELTLPPKEAPEQEEVIELSFEAGLPVALNGNTLPLHNLISELNIRAGRHGVGRIDLLENRYVGIKSREIYEAPAALTLITAHQSLEALCHTRELAHTKIEIEHKISNCIYEGKWYSPLFNALRAFIESTQHNVEGKVRMQLYKGSAVVLGRSSPRSLYNTQLATYKEKDSFDHSAAEGFINILKLPLQQYAMVEEQQRKKGSRS